MFGFDLSTFFQNFDLFRGDFEFFEEIFDIFLAFGDSNNALVDIYGEVLLDFTGILFGDGLGIFAKDLLSEGREVAMKKDFLVYLFFVYELVVFGFHLLKLFSGRFNAKGTGIVTGIWTDMAGLGFLVQF